MDESGSVDGTEATGTESARWSVAGMVLSRQQPAIFARLLALAEATVAELSAVPEEYIG
jgi:hypothetical protein